MSILSKLNKARDAKETKFSKEKMKDVFGEEFKSLLIHCLGSMWVLPFEENDNLYLVYFFERNTGSYSIVSEETFYSKVNSNDFLAFKRMEEEAKNTIEKMESKLNKIEKLMKSNTFRLKNIF